MPVLTWLDAARPWLFLGLMSVLLAGFVLMDHRRVRVLLAPRVWYPPRGPAGCEAPPSPGEDDTLRLFRLAHWHDTQGRGRDAETCYRAVLELAPMHRDALYNLAVELARQERAPEAITLYRRLLEHTPEDVDAHFNLGSLYFQLKLYPQAHQHWKQAKLADPSAVDVRTNLRLLAKLRKSQVQVQDARVA